MQLASRMLGPAGKAGCARAPVGVRKLTGVLVATIRDPSGRGPGARLSDGLRFQVEAGFGNGQPAPSLPPGHPSRPTFAPTAHGTIRAAATPPATTRTEPRFRARPGDLWLNGIGLRSATCLRQVEERSVDGMRP